MAVEVTSLHEPRRLLRRRPASEQVRAGARSARRRKLFLRLLLVVPALVLTASLIALACLYNSYSKIVDERLASGYLTSRAGIYAAPRVLRTGQSFSRERLTEVLRRAGYVNGVEGETSDVWSGRFSVEGGGDILIRPRRTAGASVSPAFDEVLIGFDRRNRIASIVCDGAMLDTYTLEPEALSNDASMKTGQRAALAYRDLPPVLVRAILAIEDRRFFDHRGVDATGIARAVWSWAVGARSAEGDVRRQGGSTITQQLVKNTYLTPERTLRRKLNEALLATILERRLTKEDILALYCNEIYLGQRGGVAVRGVGQAARVFFGKELKDLSLAEAATIAGMIQSPARYAPDRHPERAALRRNTVIDAMLGEGFINREEAASATRDAVAVAPLSGDENAVAPYFIDYVNRVVETRLESHAGGEGGRDLRVYTTIDLELQQLAEQSVRHQLDRLEKIYKGRKRPQAALVALDPHTGQVLALVGGRDYAESQLNRVTDARRQPGSVFKPFVYAAALESGISPVSMYTDAPRAFEYDRRAVYRPSNYGGAYSMRDVTMRTGLVRSLNVVTVDLALRTGLSGVAGLAESFGLPRPEAYPALALGTTEATPLQIAAAYTAFANGGGLVEPSLIVRATDADNDALVEQRDTQERQVIRPSTAYMLTDMLTAVVNQGTARAARGALKGTAVAGKTGTSRDGWFAGYTPNLVCVVWVGFDNGEQLGLTGAESALPAWVEFMRGATDLRPELGGESFVRPASVTTVEIDPATGMLASPSCPQRERIAVAPALAPSYECYEHRETYTDIASNSGSDFYTTEAATTTADLQNDPGHPASTAASAPASKIPSRLPRTASPGAPSTPPVMPATQVETSRNGRTRLTNNISVASSADGWNR